MDKLKKILIKIISFILCLAFFLVVANFFYKKVTHKGGEEFPVTASNIPIFQANQDVEMAARIYAPNVDAKMHIMFNQRENVDPEVAKKVYEALKRGDLNYVDSIMTSNDKDWKRKRKMILGEYAEVYPIKFEPVNQIDWSVTSENMNLSPNGVESTKRLYLNKNDEFIISNHSGSKVFATYDSGEKYEVVPGKRQVNDDTGYLTFYGGDKSSSFTVLLVHRN